MSTPRGTPLGTPIIGKRGHVFSVSTPEVEPETGQPLPPFPFEARTKKPVTECVSDPFDVRCKIKPPADSAAKDKSGGEEEEPVWQRRLSLLFVPPTEDELEPEKEPEETTRLLPAITTPYILRKQSVDSVASPPISRRKDREERANKKKEKEASKKERQAREKLIKEEAKQSRTNLEEENKRREEERRKKEKEEAKKTDSKFSRLRRSFSDDPVSSSSSMGSSEEDEEKEKEEEEEGKEHLDDYTSWDDTICSNRSAYFKKYYTQRGVIGKAAEEDKEAGFRSPFEASHNSLSSLIRERMGKTPPSQEKTSQLGLVVLVVVLLVVIVVGISLTHYFYHLHLLELSIFNRIKFYEGPRHLEVYDPTWKPRHHPAHGDQPAQTLHPRGLHRLPPLPAGREPTPFRTTASTTTSTRR
ncbi:capping protein inhibiting regulator of actin dynamics-like isoform X1 [Scylla paramamosain]|uniref:capping protein inhibiting regulator of actin dynamics-like isoform X1 n=1 Tax=Scylla paramamosain TaxID=85552 RepID=UPI003083C8CE